MEMAGILSSDENILKIGISGDDPQTKFCCEHGVFKYWMRGTKYFGCSFVLDLLENFLMIMITGRRAVVVVVEFNVNVLMVFGVTLCQESGSWS